MKKAVIVSACRTPVGKFLGSLKGFQATELGALSVKEAVRRADLRPEQVDEVIMGNVLSAGLGQNPARQAALKGGLPVTVPALTVNKVCGSGLKAVALAAQAIKAGDHEVIVAVKDNKRILLHRVVKINPDGSEEVFIIKASPKIIETNH